MPIRRLYVRIGLHIPFLYITPMSGSMMMEFLRAKSRWIAGVIVLMFLFSAVIPLLTLFLR